MIKKICVIGLLLSCVNTFFAQTIKISQLPSATTIAPSDIFMIVQGGANKKIPWSILNAGSGLAYTSIGGGDTIINNNIELGGMLTKSPTIYLNKNYLNFKSRFTGSSQYKIFNFESPSNYTNAPNFEMSQETFNNGDGTFNEPFKWGFNINRASKPTKTGIWYAIEPHWISGGAEYQESHLQLSLPNGEDCRLFSNTFINRGTLATSTSTWDFRSSRFDFRTLTNSQFVTFINDNDSLGYINLMAPRSSYIRLASTAYNSFLLGGPIGTKLDMSSLFLNMPAKVTNDINLEGGSGGMTRFRNDGHIFRLFINSRADDKTAISGGSSQLTSYNGGFYLSGTTSSSSPGATITYNSIMGATPSLATWYSTTFTINGDLNLSKTITTAGTTGNQTINKTSGRVNVSAGGNTVTITNSLVTANSLIQLTVASNDATAKSASVVASTGSFVIYLNAAATGETAINFMVTN